MYFLNKPFCTYLCVDIFFKNAFEETDIFLFTWTTVSDKIVHIYSTSYKIEIHL